MHTRVKDRLDVYFMHVMHFCSVCRIIHLAPPEDRHDADIFPANFTDKMSDSEDDYMSAKYLEAAAELEKSGKEKTYSQRRKEQLERQKQKGYIKPRAQMEQEAREQGLSTALGSDNVGMKMLMKMGFK